MNLSKITRYVTLAVIGLGASALTLAIFLIPDLSAGVLAGLIAGHIVLSSLRWSYVLAYVRNWLRQRFARPVMASVH